jgi:hypothetical protein
MKAQSPVAYRRAEGASEAPARILIVRPDNLGDLVLFSGVLWELRRRYPHAEIVLVVKDAYRDIASLLPPTASSAGRPRSTSSFRGRSRGPRTWPR